MYLMKFFASLLGARNSATLILGVLLSFGASAESLRCKGDFAEIGDSKGTVLQKCGEPMLKDNFCRPAAQTSSSGTSAPAAGGSAGPVTNITVNQCVNVDEWTFNPGYGQFMTMLQFEAGQLKLIKYGDRVTR